MKKSSLSEETLEVLSALHTILEHERQTVSQHLKDNEKDEWARGEYSGLYSAVCEISKAKRFPERTIEIARLIKEHKNEEK